MKKAIILLDQKRKKRNKYDFIFTVLFLISLIISIKLIKKNDTTEKMLALSFIIIGLLNILKGILDIVRQISVKEWKKITCSVISKKVNKEHGAVINAAFVKYIPIIYYSYKYYGENFVSDKIQLSEKSYNSEDEAMNKNPQYIINQNCTCLLIQKNQK